ncbi:MAG: phosphopantetheine-binding protein [Oscillospiraceae bacterium]|jgi:acyl carrier protein|nr:phosphopantetheine-binding protein [Oscillospiraceae bacterium]
MVTDKLAILLSNQLCVDIDTITLDTDIVNDLGADSLAVAELLWGIEDEFGLILTESAIADIHTVGQLAFLIDQKINE